MRRILVVGGGIAGAECALTLARGLPADRVTMLAHGDALHVVPDLVYVPVGVSASRIDVPLPELLAMADVGFLRGEVASVDVEARVARTDAGDDVPFDVVVVAPGAAPEPTSGLQLQTAEQGVELRARLDELLDRASVERVRASIVIRVSADDAWSPPAYELAAVLATRLRRLGLQDLVSLALVTAELSPFQWFEPHVADVVVAELRGLGVEVSPGVPQARLDDVEGDLVIDFGPLTARRVPGLPGRSPEGWYDVDADGRVHPVAFVVGDAAGHGFKSAFAVAWQARRMLVALGGSLAALGGDVGGVPVDAVEHHVELGTRTARIRLPVAASLQDPWLGHDARLALVDAPPDRLAGLVVGSAIDGLRGRSAAHAHRAIVSRPVSPLPAAARATRPSSLSR